jgi:FkbM family methyltransferase
MSLKRAARLLVERTFDLHILHRGKIAPAFEVEHLRNFIDHFKVDCVFDVGANAGQYAHMLRTEVGYRGNIVSFEPIPELASKLRALAASETSWFVEELALDEREGDATFNVLVADQFSSLHAISGSAKNFFKELTQTNRRIQVRTSTVAAQLRNYRNKIRFSRPFLKMDTQGHDIAVVRGAANELDTFVGLQSELAIKRLYDDTLTFDEAIAFYRARGFELSALVPNNLGHFPRLLEIDCIMYRKDLAPDWAVPGSDDRAPVAK